MSDELKAERAARAARFSTLAETKRVQLLAEYGALCEERHLARIELLEAKNTKLRAALEPFARYGELLSREQHTIPDCVPLGTRFEQTTGEITVGDLRRAQLSLEEQKQ